MDKVVQLDHRRGRLTLCSTDYFKQVLGDMYFYVEAFHYKAIEGIQYLDILAPSLDLKLFTDDVLLNKKITKENVKTFKNIYNQLLESKEAIRVLKRLETYLQQGKNIVLFCDATDLRFNHLLLLGDYFKQLDYVVDFNFTLTSINLHNVVVEKVINYV